MIDRGRGILQGQGPREHWLRRFLLSAYQASLFNDWLAARIERGWFDRLLVGDVAKKRDTGGIFEVADIDAEWPRFQRGEITHTGPIYGARMRWASGEPGDLERAILEADSITVDMLRRAKLDGTRRPARLFVPDLSVEPCPEGLFFTFSLPKGAYATTLLGEIMKAEAVLPEEDEDQSGE